MAETAVNCRKVYEQMVSNADRTKAINHAVTIAKLTLPTLAPDGKEIEEDPSTGSGIQAVRSLASALIAAGFSPGASWFDLDLLPSGWDWVRKEHGPEGEAAFRAMLDMRKIAIVNSLTLKTARSRFTSAMRRLLIEGTTAFINRGAFMDDDGKLQAGRIDVYPLRSIVAEREAGVVRVLGMLDEITPDPIEAGNDKNDSKDDYKCKYTIVNFETGQVWEQYAAEKKQSDSRRIDPGAARRRKRKVDEQYPPEALDVRQFIVAVGDVPDVGDYPDGYAYHYRRQFLMLDNVDASLNEAMSIASLNLLRLKPGSAVSRDPKSLVDKRSGDPVIADKDDIEWLPVGAHLGDFAFIANLRPMLEDQIAIAFAMRVSERMRSGPISATEILHMIKDLNNQTADLLTSIEETMLRPLFESEMYLQEQANPMFPDLPQEVKEQIVRVVVTSGANAEEKEQYEQRLILQLLPEIKALDPQFRINGKVAADALTARKQVGSLAGLYSRIDDQTWQQMQLAAAAQQSGGASPMQLPRDRMLATRGGAQPPQPKQGSPPVGPRLPAAA